MSRYFLKILCVLMLWLPLSVHAGLSLPYSNPCSSLDGMTPDVLTSQNRKWTLYNSDGLTQYQIQPRSSSTTQDAYLWLPAITFEYETAYRFAVEVKSLYDSPDGQFRLVVSDQPSRNGNIRELRPITNVSNLHLPFDCYFTPEETKELYLGIHVKSPGNAGTFYVNTIDVEEVAASVPAAVTELKATPHPNGVKKTDITFTSPAKNVLGGTLRTISRIDIFCDGEIIHTVNAPKVNTPISHTFNASSCGRHVFTVRASGNTGTGATAAIVGRAGTQLPAPDYDYDGRGMDFRATTTYTPEGNVSLKWRQPESAQNIKYNVYRMPGDVKVVNQTADTVFIEKALVSADPLAYWYRVEEIYPDSVATRANSTIVSLYNSIPFHANFTDQESVFEYSIFDADHDSGWWNYHSGSKTVRATNTDDWLVTPGITLEPGKLYRLDIDAFANYRPVCYSASIGRSNDWHSLDTELLENYRITSKTSDIRTKFFRVPEEGQYFIGIHAHDPREPSNFNTIALRSISVEEVNENIPQNVDNLKWTLDTQDVTKGNITMTAPTLSVGDSQLPAITKIELYKNGELTETKTEVNPGTSVNFNISVTPGIKDDYRIVPYTSSGKGIESSTSVLVFVPEYLNEFGDNASIDEYTVIDGNTDGSTWDWFNYQARCYPSSDNGADEWLITPAMRLEAGKYYRTSLVTTNEKKDLAYNIMKVCVGTSPSAEAMTEEIIKPYIVTGVGYDQRALLKDYFTVDQTGEYYIGIHNRCDNGRYGSPLLIDNLTISSKINGEVPDTVTSFLISPDQTGKLSGQLNFKAPLKALNGTLLDKNTPIKIHVYKDGASVGTLDALPGENIGTPINFDTQGVHLITVICTNSFGVGREREDVAFFGINRAGNPKNVVVKENPDKYGEVIITWDHNPNDFDGFPMNPEHLTYEIINLTGEEETIIKSGITGTSYTFQGRSSDMDQAFMRFAVRARTVTGGSQGIVAPYISVGRPYSMPLLESFPNYNPKMAMIQQTPEDGGYAAWGFNDSDPFGNGCYDNDNGMALMEAIFAGGKQRLITGKIDLRNAQKPVLAIRVLNPKGLNTARNLIEIQVSTHLTAEDDWESVEEHEIHAWADGEKGWQRMEVDLSEYKGHVIYIGIVGTAVTHTFTCFDAFEVAEAKQKNLGVVNFDCPEEAYPGQNQTLSLRIKNHGHTKAENYAVELYRNGELYKTIQGVSLNPGEKHTFDFIESLNQGNAGNNSYYAQIAFDGDEDPYDNKSKTYSITILDSEFPAVNALTGQQSSSEAVTLNWEAPVIPEKPEQITDDMEKYPSWATMHNGGIGKYTLYDRDDAGIAGIQGVTLPNVDITSKQSWFVFDRTMEPFDKLEIANSHSGNKFLACMALYERGTADDWLVSPELTGEAQTISFWARSYHPNYPESFEILATGTDKTLDNICREENSLGFQRQIPAEWTFYSFDLPAGSKYFAIRRYSIGGFMMFIDDLTFTPAGNERLHLMGYNIYLDGDLQNNTPVTTKSFTHNPGSSGTHTYGVTALYDLGESPLAEVQVGFVGVKGINGEEIRIEGHKAKIVVRGANNMNVGISALDGKTIFSAKAHSDELTIPAAPGIYVVSVAGKAAKITVR